MRFFLVRLAPQITSMGPEDCADEDLAYEEVRLVLSLSPAHEGAGLAHDCCVGFHNPEVRFRINANYGTWFEVFGKISGPLSRARKSSMSGIASGGPPGQRRNTGETYRG